MKKFLPILLFILILCLGAFLRLYRIREYMIFLGDEGRDVLVVKRMIIDHKFTLLGPVTSVGSMYIGPIYYYFMIPFLWATNMDPVGPAIMVALFGVATIWLIYHLLIKYYTRRAAIVASFLYAISPLTIIQGRSSWNPNIVPFFSLLIIYALCKTVVDKKFKYLFLVGLAFGICLQLHYIVLMFLPIIFLSLLYIRFKLPFKYYLLLVIGFIIAFSPFLAFEIRHSFTNIRAVLTFLAAGGKSSVIGLSSIFFTVQDVFIRLFWRLVIIRNAEITKLFMLLLFLTLGFYYFKNKKKRSSFIVILSIWFFTGLISYGLYKGVIYDYYFVPMFTLPFIVTAIFIDRIWDIKKIGLPLATLIIITLIYFNISQNPLLIPPNNLLSNTQTISRFVYEQVDHRSYNFALIAGRNSDHAYRYFLELWGSPPVTLENPTVDPARKTITEELYVVCEEKICQPLGHPLWEIAGFGRAEIADQWTVSTATIFKLVHYKKV